MWTLIAAAPLRWASGCTTHTDIKPLSTQRDLTPRPAPPPPSHRKWAGSQCTTPCAAVKPFLKAHGRWTALLHPGSCLEAWGTLSAGRTCLTRLDDG